MIESFCWMLMALVFIFVGYGGLLHTNEKEKHSAGSLFATCFLISIGLVALIHAIKLAWQW